MSLQSEFIPLELDQLRREAAVLKADGWRFMQTHAVNGEEGIDLYYSFMNMKDMHVVNYRIAGVTKETPVPSITDMFLAAFVFENEARELFGVDMRDIAIDFQGAMYAPAQLEPMTFITPEQKAAKEKAAKAAAAKAAKEAAAGEKSADETASPRAFVLTDEKRAKLEEKLATMSPEKVAKVRAALAAREAEATASPAPEASSSGETNAKQAAVAEAAKQVEPELRAGRKADAAAGAGSAASAGSAGEAALEKPVDHVLEEKLAALGEEKAAKVRAAIAAKQARDGGEPLVADAGTAQATPDAIAEDETLSQLIAQMDEAKAAKVRAALSRKGGN